VFEESELNKKKDDDASVTANVSTFTNYSTYVKEILHYSFEGGELEFVIIF